MKTKSNFPKQSRGREVVFTRFLNAPRDLVFKAWTDPGYLQQWWGPVGFTRTTHEIEVAPGGVWRFTLRRPNGAAFDNTISYTNVVEPEFISYSHSDDEHGEHFAAATFSEERGGTRLTLRMVFGSLEERDEAVECGCIGCGNRTFDCLEDYLLEMTSGVCAALQVA